MENSTTSTTATLNQLKISVASLQENIEDVTLTQDDLAAIEEGHRDHALGRTRRL